MEEEITIDLRELAHIVQKNARFIAKVTGGCIAVAGLYLLIASPVYESDSLLRIKQPKGIGSSLLESMPMGNAMASKQLMSTYAEILKSPASSSRLSNRRKKQTVTANICVMKIISKTG